ncbi:SIMPL domain-containing protein [Denitromonas sp.]|uniref:SIMPL domain-containing protein n=1 Tax=Denitromonas sp. TaxID=2734609 RepID=UPI002B0027E3|nr:SIMPL domain-containing protein [Denitromonas sp.]
MNRSDRWRRATIALLATFTFNTYAADALPTIELSAQGTAVAVNDLARADAYFEAQADEPAAVAQKVNQVIAAALSTAKAYSTVSVKTGSTSTWPIYSNPSSSGRSNPAITGWRMRSQLALESTDIAALSRLIGELQSTLAIGNLQLMPAPATLRAANDEATREALKAFEARARLVTETLGRKYRLKALNINEQGNPMPMFRGAAMAEMAVKAAPVEAGDSTISVHVNGTIELID